MRRIHALLGLAAILPATAQAQDFSMMANWAQGQMIQDNLERNLGTATHTDRPPVYATGPGIRVPRNPGNAVAIPITPHRNGQPAPAAPAPAIHGSTAYRASPAVRDRVRAQFVAFIQKTSGPAAAQAMATELKSKDYLALWAASAASDGLKPGDVADAMTEYWVQNWQMANGVNFAPPAQVRAVRDQVRTTMLRNPRFATLSDAEKQEMAEVFIYNQALQTGTYVAASKRGDHATTQRIADASVQRFRNEMHVDLRQLALTDQGFVPKG
jgi:hypothetical protein